MPDSEVVRMYIASASKERLVPLDYDRVFAEWQALRAAYLQIFPYESYRSLRKSFGEMKDVELANHYLEHGIHEGLQIEPEALA